MKKKNYNNKNIVFIGNISFDHLVSTAKTLKRHCSIGLHLSVILVNRLMVSFRVRVKRDMYWFEKRVHLFILESVYTISTIGCAPIITDMRGHR